MGKAFSKVQKKLKDTGGKLSGTLAKVPLSETAYKMALPVITLRYNGLFDFDGWYASMVDWSKNYGYLFLESIYTKVLLMSKFDLHKFLLDILLPKTCQQYELPNLHWPFFQINKHM